MLTAMLCRVAMRSARWACWSWHLCQKLKDNSVWSNEEPRPPRRGILKFKLRLSSAQRWTSLTPPSYQTGTSRKIRPNLEGDRAV
jgi:hypothetical protein